MKKISLKNLNLKEVNQLSREQLKNILGGSGSGSGSGSGTDPNPKITACNGKSANAACSWTYQGATYSGRCASIAPSYVLHCSDLL